MLEKKGNISVAALEQDIFVGSRQLHLQEKNFNIWWKLLIGMGIPTSRIYAMILKYHSMNMADARRYAAQNAVWTET